MDSSPRDTHMPTDTTTTTSESSGPTPPPRDHANGLGDDELVALLHREGLQGYGRIRMRDVIRGQCVFQIDGLEDIPASVFIAKVRQLEVQCWCVVDVYVQWQPLVCVEVWINRTWSIAERGTKPEKSLSAESDGSHCKRTFGVAGRLCLWCILQRLCATCPLPIAKFNVTDVSDKESEGASTAIQLFIRVSTAEHRMDLRALVESLMSLSVFGCVTLHLPRLLSMPRGGSDFSAVVVVSCSLNTGSLLVI